MTTNPEKTFPVLLTREQALAILQLIDLAVKSSGLQVAAAAVAIPVPPFATPTVPKDIAFVALERGELKVRAFS